jgi:predicted nucleic acid-binding protein
MNVLVDTSVWSLALRRKPGALNLLEKALVDELTELIREGRAQLIGIVRQELLSGIRTGAQFEKLRNVLRSFPDQPVETSDYEAAAKASNDCRGKGVVSSVVDMLICAVALTRHVAIFTTDPDFTNYSKVFPLTLHAPRKAPQATDRSSRAVRA